MPELADEAVTVVRFNLFGYLDQDAAAAFIESMWEQDVEDPNAWWEVCINSEGGNMEAGTAIFSELRSHALCGGGQHMVTCRVRGQAASCGSLVLQAGDDRVAGKMDHIMMHEPCMTVEDAPLQRVRDELAQADSWMRQFLDVLMERATVDRSVLAAGMSGRDWWISSDMALTYGLIDRIA